MYPQVIGNECVTGRQFHEKVTAAVQLFKWKEVAPNGRVLIVISPCVEFYVVCVATLIIGVFALFLCMLLLQHTLELLYKHCHPVMPCNIVVRV